MLKNKIKVNPNPKKLVKSKYTRYFSSFEKLYNQSYTVLEAAGGGSESEVYTAQ